MHSIPISKLGYLSFNDPYTGSVLQRHLRETVKVAPFT